MYGHVHGGHLAVILQSHDVTCEPKQLDDPPSYLVNPHIKLGPEGCSIFYLELSEGGCWSLLDHQRHIYIHIHHSFLFTASSPAGADPAKCRFSLPIAVDLAGRLYVFENRRISTHLPLISIIHPSFHWIINRECHKHDFP